MRRLIDVWVNRPTLDYLLVAAAAVIAVWSDPQTPDAEYLSSWYQTLASVSGVLLGFGGVAVTVVFAVTPSRRLAKVYEATGPRLATLVMSCLGGLALATAGFLALFLIPADSSTLRNGATAGLVVYGAARFGRLWWLFGRVLVALMAKDDAEDPPVHSDPDWNRPKVNEGDYSLASRRARRRAQ